MALSLIIAIQACQPSQEKIMASAGTVMNVNKQIDSCYLELKYAFESYDNARIDAQIEQLKAMLISADEQLMAMDLPDHCSDLRKSLSDKIMVMKQLAEKELNEQVRIYKIDEADFTDNLRQEWDAYASSTEQKMKAANAKVSKSFEKISNETQNK